MGPTKEHYVQCIRGSFFQCDLENDLATPGNNSVHWRKAFTFPQKMFENIYTKSCNFISHHNRPDFVFQMMLFSDRVICVCVWGGGGRLHRYLRHKRDGYEFRSKYVLE